MSHFLVTYYYKPCGKNIAVNRFGGQTDDINNLKNRNFLLSNTSTHRNYNKKVTRCVILDKMSVKYQNKTKTNRKLGNKIAQQFYLFK